MKKYQNLFIAILMLLPLFLNAQINEKIDRGVVALNVDEGKVYIGWRLLNSDPENVAFNVYRKDIGFGGFEKVNISPVTASTNYIDTTSAAGHGYIYKIATTLNGQESDSPGEAYVFTLSGNQPYYSIRLKDQVELKRVGIGDLDGDGAYDFVIQHPDFNVDPYFRPGYWKRSPEPYKLDAYSSKGKFADIDLDGKDELVAGTFALDDDGTPMWRTGLGHNDAGYVADFAWPWPMPPWDTTIRPRWGLNKITT